VDKIVVVCKYYRDGNDDDDDVESGVGSGNNR
jgi:hypothetical protein